MTGKTLNIAVQGCCHGELDAIYSSIKSAEQRTGEAVDLLVVCGDFQCARIEEELTSMAVPPKHRKLTNFCEYLMGLRVAPVPTIFVGGNHEASNVLQALPYGGELRHQVAACCSLFVCQRISYDAFSFSRLCGSPHLLPGQQWRREFQRPPHRRR